MIGDVLTSTVLFESLKKEYPNCELHYLINSHTDAVVKGNPHIDNIVYFTTEHGKSKLKFLSLIKSIHKEGYDVVLDVYGKLSSQLITKFSGAPIRIGYHKKLSAFYYSESVVRAKIPTKDVSLAIENRMRLLQPLKIDFNPLEPKIYLENSEKETARQVLLKNKIKSDQPLFMISILGSQPDKSYPSSYMATLLDEIIVQAPQAQLLFNYIPSQFKEVQSLYNMCNSGTQKSIHLNIFGESLRSFLSLLSQCDAMIGNEGGGINMAKALGIPCFIIFSPHLNRANWFGKNEEEKHIAVHLTDYIKHEARDRKLAKSAASEYYKKLKPTFIIPKLKEFLHRL